MCSLVMMITKKYISATIHKPSYCLLLWCSFSCDLDIFTRLIGLVTPNFASWVYSLI